MLATFEGNPTVNVMVAYAPTEDKNDDEKSTFYAALESTIASIPPHNMILIAGDFNARIGRDSGCALARIIGQHLFHEQSNDNGERLNQLCLANNLRIAAARFPYRPSRVWTWLHPNGSNKAQIDHILVNKKWVNSIRNCRAYNSINVGSDHRIVCSQINASLRCSAPSTKLPKIDWSKLIQPNIKSKFELELKNVYPHRRTAKLSSIIL